MRQQVQEETEQPVNPLLATPFAYSFWGTNEYMQESPAG
jgi:hypothetical protein